MEHYSLRQPAQGLSVPDGLRVVRVHVQEAEGGDWEVGHEVLRVVGVQPTVVHHFSREEVAPVHSEPSLMEEAGWRYERVEMRYAPVVITFEGRLIGLDPEDPRWFLIDPDVSEDRMEIIIEVLKAKEVERQVLERRIEEEEEVGREVEED
jgi:hypothetical protein